MAICEKDADSHGQKIPANARLKLNLYRLLPGVKIFLVGRASQM